MPTQAELEKFMSGLSLDQSQGLDPNFQRKRKADSPAQGAANILSQREAGGFRQPHLGSGRPDIGIGLEFGGPSAPAAIAQVPESKIDSSGVASVGPGTAPGVPDVVDRYQSQYDAALSALDEYENRSISRAPDERYGEAAYGRRVRRHAGSSEKSSLIRKFKSAERLLREGSFADTTNVKKQLRQAQAATASNLMASSKLRGQEFEYGEQEKDFFGKGTSQRPTITNEIYDELVKSLLTGSN